MKTIPLTRNMEAIVDDEDYEILKTSGRWFASQKTKGCFYATKTKKIKRINHSVLLHRFILGLKEGDGLSVDHINGNRLDNRRSNLRICSHQQNTMNSKKKGNGLYKGVHWHKAAKKWVAEIKHNYKNIYLGLFLTVEEAALAYNKKAQELFGEYANLNEVPK